MTGLRRYLPLLRTLAPALFAAASALACARAPAEDILIVTDGMKTGTVEGYAGGICWFDGTAIPRASIYFIGLDAELPPPAPQDGTRDEVHLRDGSVNPGRLVSIDATNVVTAGAVHPRKLVAWIWLTPATPGEQERQKSGANISTAKEADEKADRATYEWEGTIKVENRYNGSHGRHLWRAEFRVRFYEIPTSSIPAQEGGGEWLLNDFEPLSLDYQISADALRYGDDRHCEDTMLGQASGRLDLRKGGALNGAVILPASPIGIAYDPPASFASDTDYLGLAAKVASASEPGWYTIDIDFYQYGSRSDAETRALYQGIHRGGTCPLVGDDPDQDFLDHVPAMMPRPLAVNGRLDRPDQTEVRGNAAFPYGVAAAGDTAWQITIEWFFRRTRQ